MIISRLVMLTFDSKGLFNLSKVLLYINETLDLTVCQSFEYEKEDQLLEIIRHSNKQ